MDYLGTVANCSDVIRLTYKSGKQKLYTSVDEDGYGIYNNERSIYKGEHVWEYNHGSIREITDIIYKSYKDKFSTKKSMVKISFILFVKT